jgi:hypothetical protein
MLACAALPAHAEPPVPLAPKHPVIGIWKWTLPDSSCSETYIFHPNGHLSATSGEETAESVFEIAAEPDAKGFYRWHDKAVRTNGRNDCSGNPTPVGDTVTIWIHFDRSGDRIVVCTQESLDNCFGPLTRQKGDGA